MTCRLREHRYVESRRREDRPAEEPRVEHRHSPLTQEVQASRAASFEIGRNVMSHSPPVRTWHCWGAALVVMRCRMVAVEEVVEVDTSDACDQYCFQRC
jgi:hypothetical protein